MSSLTDKARARRKIAEEILETLDLIRLWNRVGQCQLVGAVAYDLVVAPDIDMDILCPQARIEDGFDILKTCALHPKVVRTRFFNGLGPPHYGLYWRVDFDHGDHVWKIDMWSILEEDAWRPCGRHLTEPMKQALTPTSRETILALKEAVLADPDFKCPSFQIYRAVLDARVETLDALKQWTTQNPLAEGATDWKPTPAAKRT